MPYRRQVPVDFEQLSVELAREQAAKNKRARLLSNSIGRPILDWLLSAQSLHQIDSSTAGLASTNGRMVKYVQRYTPLKPGIGPIRPGISAESIRELVTTADPEADTDILSILGLEIPGFTIAAVRPSKILGTPTGINGYRQFVQLQLTGPNIPITNAEQQLLTGALAIPEFTHPQVYNSDFVTMDFGAIDLRKSTLEARDTTISILQKHLIGREVTLGAVTAR